MLCFKIKMEDRNSGTEVGFFILCLKIRTAMRWYGLEDMSHWVHAGFWTFIQGFYFLHLLHFASCTPIAQKYPHFLQRHPHAREAPLYVCATKTHIPRCTLNRVDFLACNKTLLWDFIKVNYLFHDLQVLTPPHYPWSFSFE